LRQKSTDVIYLADASGAFLSSPPEWTLTDTVVTWPDGDAGRLEQRPFHWANGVWEAEVMVHRANSLERSHRVLVHVAPETLRRWKDVGIDPVLEARAQIQDHLRRALEGEISLLTLL
jgi:hypothetical protein